MCCCDCTGHKNQLPSAGLFYFVCLFLRVIFCKYFVQIIELHFAPIKQ